MINFIKPHDPNWKIEFENLKHVLCSALLDVDIDIQHVGSTSIPDLYAKPILDIDIIINDTSQLDVISSRLEKLGYINRGEQGIAGRFAFRQSSDATPATDNHRKWLEHHLYACFPDSLALKNHLLFRDILLNNKKLVAEYSQLKLDVSNEKGMTRELYTKRKTAFILKILAEHGLDSTELDQIKRSNA
jgi:GrpB-like predicted nucleotidyltransferase (UPF0157 family)